VVGTVRSLAILLALQLLTAQSGPTPTVTQSVASEKTKDAALEKVVSRVLRLAVEDLNYYWYNRVDLDGDGVPEVLLQVQGPFVCGSGGGCPLVVLKKSGNTYTRVATLSPTWMSVVVSDHKTHGWSDLVLWRSSYGNASPSHYEVAVFDGKTYSRNPSATQAPQPDVPVRGAAYMIDSRNSSSGILLTR